MQWETVIGLEVHAQLATKSKIFSGAATAYGALPNTQACAIDLGMQTPEIRCNLGNLYRYQKNLQGAIEQYLIAINLNPKFAAAHNNLAVVFGQQGKLGLSREHSKIALQLGFPVHPEILEHLRCHTDSAGPQ